MGTAASFCEQLGITTEELHSRLAFLSFSDEDRRNLADIGRVIHARIDGIIAAFYEHLNGFEELRAILSQPGLMTRLKEKQRDYLLTLGQSADARAYAEGRLRIGFVHERVGLKQKWYLGAYSALFRIIVACLVEEHAGDVRRLLSLIMTVDKLLRFDLMFAVDTYYHSTTQRLADSLQELHRAHQQLLNLSRQDPLTQVANRRALMDWLELELQRCRRYGHPLALLFLDVDRFKRVNDSYGHAVGDRVLQQVARIAASVTRPPDLVGRYGGEEFAIGLVECDLAGARLIAERIRTAIEQASVTTDQAAVAVTVSIGIAALTGDCASAEVLLARADRALYRAKAAGRNRVEIDG